MSVTYFGECDSAGVAPGGLSSQAAFWTVWNDLRLGTEFTCPGSGNQDVQDLSVYIDGLSTVHVRVAVYSNDGATLMAQGSAAVLLNVAGSPAWQGHLSAGAITQSHQLVGGTTYRLIASTDAAATWEYATAGYTTNDNQYILNLDETGGYPTPAPSASAVDFGAHIIIRCGVQPAAGSAPTLTTVSPNTGNHNTTVAVTLTGTNFVATGLAVSISGSNVAVTGVTYVSPTSVTCNFVIDNTAAAGGRNVSVTTVNGTSGNQTFTINTIPTITSLSVNSQNPGDSNTASTITGTGLASSGFGISITPATDLTVHSVVWVSATSATFQVDAAGGAAPGTRSLKATQSVGGDTNSVAWIINGATGGAGGGVSFGSTSVISLTLGAE